MTTPHSGDWLDELLEMTHGGCQIVADGVYKSCNESAKKAILSKRKLEVLEGRIDELERHRGNDMMLTGGKAGIVLPYEEVEARLKELENERSKIEGAV